MRHSHLILWLGYSYSHAASDFFAVLVAGSKGFSNYRHQADICYQYHLLVDLIGIEPRNIIVLMFDDAAWSASNPLLGRLFNEPNGKNLYKGCKIDFRGEDVSLLNFYNSVSSVPSTPNSTILISYVDHGEPGALLFPNDEKITENSMEKFLRERLPPHKRLIMYVEACNAGSVFENIARDVLDGKIIIAASSGTEFSWATYCPTPGYPWADGIEGHHIGVCLADLFAVAWTRDLMYRIVLDSDPGDTFGDHIESVRNFVAPKSSVAVFGDPHILSKNLWDVFPLKKQTTASVPTNNIPHRQNILQSIQPLVHDTSQLIVRSVPESQHYLL